MTIEQAKIELSELEAKERELWAAVQIAQKEVDRISTPWHKTFNQISQLKAFIKFNNGEQGEK